MEDHEKIYWQAPRRPELPFDPVHQGWHSVLGGPQCWESRDRNKAKPARAPFMISASWRLSCTGSGPLGVGESGYSSAASPLIGRQREGWNKLYLVGGNGGWVNNRPGVKSNVWVSGNGEGSGRCLDVANRCRGGVCDGSRKPCPCPCQPASTTSHQGWPKGSR